MFVDTFKLTDFNECSDLTSKCDDVKRELKRTVESASLEWNRAAKREVAAFDPTDVVMDFDARTLELVVHYPHGLVTVVDQARQLSAVGVKLSEEVEVKMKQAARFYRFALLLHQVASFYNNVAKEIEPSQKGLLVADASEFEATIQKYRMEGQRKITWENAKELKNFVVELRRKKDEFESKNRALRQAHRRIIERITSLLSVNMVRQVSG